MARILVLGGSGLVGGFLISRLIQADHEVVAISRRPQTEGLQGGVQWKLLDIEQPGAAAEIGDFDIVISLLPIWLTASLCCHLADRQTSPERVIALSSRSAVTKVDSANAGERSLALRLGEGERDLRQLAPRIKSTVFRPTMIYGGPGDRNVERVARQLIRFRVFPLIGRGAGMRQPVHADDLASAVVQALTCPATEGRIYDVGGGEVLSFILMIERIGQVNSVTPIFIRLPLLLARGVLGLASVFPQFRRIPPGSLSRIQKDMTVDNSAATIDLGYMPRPFEPARQV